MFPQGKGLKATFFNNEDFNSNKESVYEKRK